jgi:hypothetical protein
MLLLVSQTDPFGIIIGEFEFEDTVNFGCVPVKVLVTYRL